MEVPKSIFVFLVVGLFLISINRKRNYDKNAILKWQVFITSYILLLRGVFTVLGGESASGISFSNRVIWFLLLISLFEIFSQWKKLKSSQSISS